MIIANFIQLFLVSVFHQVPDTHNMQLGLKYTPKSHPSEQVLHAFSDHQDFILLVRTVTIFPKIIFNSSYTEKFFFLLYELIQDLSYSFFKTRAITPIFFRIPSKLISLLTYHLLSLPSVKTVALIYMGRNARKPVFGVSDKVVFKSACCATETS